MRKDLISIIIISCFIMVFFTGCINENNNGSNEKKYFLGTWEGEVEERYISYEFKKDNTYKYTIKTKKANGTWELSNNQLILTIAGNSHTFNYTFSDNYQSLTLNPVKFSFSYTLEKK
ncbi:MAG: DUF4923 family protein [Candidatus Thermoplasmatota archaeon]